MAVDFPDLEKIVDNYERVRRMRVSDTGKYRVIGVDKFDYEDWIHGEYDTAEEALAEASKMTEEGKDAATSHDIATVYYAYDPQGRYLGGDSWTGYGFKTKSRGRD
jgi:hypothetical protein